MSLPPTISLEEFGVDPQLCAWAEASQGQRLLFRLIDALPPANAVQAAIFEEIAGRPWADDLLTIRKVILFLLGIDSGKSSVAAITTLHRALFTPLDLRPGQRACGLIIGPDVEAARITLGYVRGLIKASPIIAAEVEGDPGDTIRLRRPVDIRVLAASTGGRAGRSRRFTSAVFEEASFWRDASTGKVNDADHFKAIRPRLLRGAQCLFISTPWRRVGLMHDFFKREYGRSETALVLQGSTRIFRPDKDAAEYKEALALDAESARTEYDAQWPENVSGLFADADLDAVTEAGVTRREPLPGFRYVAAIDPSGMKNDPFALCILGRRDDLILQFAARTWKPGVPVSLVITDIKSECDRFELRAIVSDQYGSLLTAELFAKVGLTVTERPFTSGAGSPKTLGFLALRELIVSRGIVLLDDPNQARELRSLEVTKLAAGGERVSAPVGRGFHDDQSSCLALGCHELGGGRHRSAALELMKRRMAERAEEKDRETAHLAGLSLEAWRRQQQERISAAEAAGGNP